MEMWWEIELKMERVKERERRESWIYGAISTQSCNLYM
jgi:hypothetical protein